MMNEPGCLFAGVHSQLHLYIAKVSGVSVLHTCSFPGGEAFFHPLMILFNPFCHLHHIHILGS